MFGAFFRKLYYRIPLCVQVSACQSSLAEIRTLLKALHTGLAYPALEALRDRQAARQGPKSLHWHEARVCSQNGEDGVLQEIFKRIGATSKTFVEIGVGDGRENNTAFLFSLGWSGYWIDGNAQFVAQLRARNLAEVHGLRYAVEIVDQENVARLLTNLGAPPEFDLLSIDVDQNTYYIWRALAKFRPRVVVIEYNAMIPPEIDWKVTYDARRSWDDSINFGASLKAYENLGRELGYSLVHCELAGTNAFFVRSDLVADRFCDPFTAEFHYQPPRFGLFYRYGHPAAILDRAPVKA